MLAATGEAVIGSTEAAAVVCCLAGDRLHVSDRRGGDLLQGRTVVEACRRGLGGERVHISCAAGPSPASLFLCAVEVHRSTGVSARWCGVRASPTRYGKVGLHSVGGGGTACMRLDVLYALL